MKILSKISVVVLCFVSSMAVAADIEWSGLYRIEGVSRYKPDLATGSRGIDYGLQHLILRPKIVASDGFTIRSQFDVLNSYPGTHLGGLFGGGVHSSDTTVFDRNQQHSGTTSNIYSSNSTMGNTIEISQLYLTWDHEFGSLVVGRTPLQFGLGMTYSAGMGLFDHFYDTMDMVGYKLVFGNIFVMPMIGKQSGGAVNRNDDVRDYFFQAQYDSPENDIELGAMYHLRNSNDQGSDGPILDADGNIIIGDATATPTATSFSSVSIQTINLYALKDTPNWHLGGEFSFQNGQTGIQTTAGDRVTISAFGVATEIEWRPQESSWKWGLKAGYATGDDPKTAGTYEGYLFNRNYDVAFLLFNHQLGQFDVFRTRLIGGGGGTPDNKTEIGQPDIDTISNVLYVAPYAVWKLSDRWNMKGVLATGYLNVDPTSSASGAKDVGYEVDYSINFTPRKGITWSNEVGMLFPGSAFKGGSANLDTGFTYGVQTRAAISF